jgi:riboflavin kinase/FMN adenylyltransferase
MTFTGVVIKGEGLGRKLGVPTANISVEGPVPERGVWACVVDGLNDHPWRAVCNVGVRPTVSGEAKLTVEVHVPAFDADLYGKRLTVRLTRKLRDEKKFGSLDELKAQIGADIAAALQEPS